MSNIFSFGGGGDTDINAEIKSITLYANGWVDGVYTISDDRITTTSVQNFTPAKNITLEQLSALQAAGIVEGDQIAGQLTIRAVGIVPTVDIPVNIIFTPGIQYAEIESSNLPITVYENFMYKINELGACGACSRWLRFDPDNKKGLIIKGGTVIKKQNGQLAYFSNDMNIDLTDVATGYGVDYFVYLLNNGTVSAGTSVPDNGVKIGRFHTLCANVGNISMVAPAAPSSGLTANSSKYLIKGYREDKDPDFYNFYNKTITAITVQTQYDVVTMPHPLSGYVAGDILPESVFCLNFFPNCLYEDGMVYDKDTDTCIDIYLQSGSGHSTRSAFGATHRVSKSPFNHAEDMRMVGKRLLRDREFTSAALGSNERTNIAGSADATVIGGHSDTSGRRMVSAIGCEEMCGYLWQWLDEVAPVGGSSWGTTDGHASFGQEYGTPYVLLAGGSWYNGSFCGSRSRDSDDGRSAVNASGGGRGASQIIRG